VDDKKYYAIYDAKLAGMLLLMKCNLENTREDRKEITKKVFFFHNTNHFKKQLDIAIRNKKQIEDFIKEVR
jgi:hypothetical protein